VKNIIIISLLLFVLCQTQNAQVKSITSEQIALMDSLLSDGNIAPLDSCLISDMPPACIAKENSITFPWDSVKSEYVALLQRLKRISTDEQPTTQNLTAIYEVNAERFQKRFAGELAENSFNKFRQQTIDGSTKEAMKYYLIANDFREKYIIAEKNRLHKNEEDLKTLISSGRYDVAQRLVQIFRDEDRQSPAYKAVNSAIKQRYHVTLDARYERYAEDLRQKMYIQEVKAQTGFRTMDYSVGLGLGGIVLMEEPWPNFYQKHIAEITRFEEGKDMPKSFFGYMASINFSYYLINQLNLEFEYFYGKVESKHQPFIAEDRYGYNIIFAGINLPIICSSMSIIGNYHLFINNLIHPFVGCGISYTLFKTSANGTFHDDNLAIDFAPIHYDDYQYNGCREQTESIRFIVRPGIEYISSENSNFSYNLLCDISINLHSSASVSTLCLFPRFRVSWLF